MWNVCMKKCLILFIAIMIPFSLFGQSYGDLWKKADAAGEKDLPKTQYEILQQIVSKAAKKKDYGHLLKAELQSASVMAAIAPDSLQPAVQAIQARCDETTDEVLKLVYQTVLYRLYQVDGETGRQEDMEKPRLTPELCRRLAKVKDKAYAPFVIEGVDAGIFGHDLLSVVACELEDYEAALQYYESTGNRRAVCIMGALAYGYGDTEKLDALMETYGDLPEAGELALKRYRSGGFNADDAKAERLDFIHKALKKWAKWPRIHELSDEERELTNPCYEVVCDRQVVRPRQSQEARLKNIRNISSLSMKIYKVRADGNIALSLNSTDGYKKLKPLLEGVVAEQTRTFTGRKPYEYFDDTISVEGLPVGVYMVEFTSVPSTTVIRKLYFVTDIYTIAESQPSSEGVRYVVVSSTTGQPVAGAHLQIVETVGYNKHKTTEAVADEKGEYIYKAEGRNHNCKVFAYTDSDRACPELSTYGSYSYYAEEDMVVRTCIYTDRAIYRPGQTVHASALLYQVVGGMEQSVRTREMVTFTLRDANYKVVEEKRVMTDDYGVCAADLTLPSSGLTGTFTIQVNGRNQTIRVEEYKRPTFHVDFPEVKQAYAAGDTLSVKATAMSYAGVPVQGAKVSYKVLRRTAFWWWSYSRYWDSAAIGYRNDGIQVSEGETVTGDDGQFTVEMPFDVPETSYPMFYHFVVTADVTDSAGETHTGELSLPLGNRQQALSIDMADKLLLDDDPKATFHLLNAAGQDMDAKVRYQVDGGEWMTVQTNTPFTVRQLQLKSGRHQLAAVCEGDTVNHSFVLFSLQDTIPATETDDWFYQSASQFADEKTPVVVQVGSSDKDVHIVYSIFSGDRLIRRGAVERSNELLNIKLTYKEEYENGLLLTFAWVKNGTCHTHTAEVTRPVPDKKLRLQWSTFRDRLTPGQKEEWTLTVKGPDGQPADAQLMATLYDQSLDQIVKHRWMLSPYLWLPLPSTSWNFAGDTRLYGSAYRSWKRSQIKALVFSTFDKSVYPSAYYRSFRRFSRGAELYEEGALMAMDATPMTGAVMKSARAASAPLAMEEMRATNGAVEVESDEVAEPQGGEQVQLRENLNETAFFYPKLTTDKNGVVTLKFTLPESLTTWRFLGLAHTRDLSYGSIEAEAVARKDVMIQPNMPRFLRDGDKGVLTARIFNTSDKDLSAKAQLRLINPETNATVFEQSKPVVLKAGQTATAEFGYTPDDAHSLLICVMSVSGQGFSDGEQHYLPVLPSTERITVTMPITQHEPGAKTIDLASMIPADGRNGKLVLEYTNSPAWLMIQTLPTVGTPLDDNAISQAASYYANMLGKYILSLNPDAKKAFALWKEEEKQSEASTLQSQLEKNQELKDLVLSETPWVLDADRETEQRRRLADFFDENLMDDRLNSAISKLEMLQQSDGSWTWWKDMPGSFYMTVAVSEMLVRLNAMTGESQATSEMLADAFSFMGNEIVAEVNEMKKEQKKGLSQSFPSFKALQWLYLATLDGRQLPQDVQAANDYLITLLKKDIKSQSIYEKALTAVILSKSDAVRAREYAQSLKEYTVLREEMGRYYDTPRAGYSWYDYKIPTQTVAIEALQLLTPDDRQTIEEMQRWLLQQKRTQAWDTPINSVNAVYAFLGRQGDKETNALRLDAESATVQVDGKTLSLPKATAAVGYVKTAVPVESRSLTVRKTAGGTSWGAVYAQFTQPTKTIADSGSGLTIQRELIGEGRKVGDRLKVRITITADRDYDFVQVVDKRAACLEPVRQLSGWHQGSYCAPKDYSTNYYFDCLSKGKHVIENEYFIDRTGTYETGTCTVECAYAPEFRAVTKSQTMIIK